MSKMLYWNNHYMVPFKLNFTDFFIQHKCSDYINKLYNTNCSEKYIAIFKKCTKKSFSQ